MRHTALAILIMLCTAVPASAADFPRTRLIAYGEVSIPMEPDWFQDGHNLGIGGGIGLGFRLALPLLVVAQVDFTSFGLSNDARDALGVPDGGTFGGGEASIFYGSVGLRWNVFKLTRVWPYLVAGGGYYNRSRDDLVVNGVPESFDREKVWGAHAGAGLDLALGPYMDLFVEGVYVVGFTETANTISIPIRFGLAIDLGMDIE